MADLEKNSRWGKVDLQFLMYLLEVDRFVLAVDVLPVPVEVAHF